MKMYVTIRDLANKVGIPFASNQSIQTQDPNVQKTDAKFFLSAEWWVKQDYRNVCQSQEEDTSEKAEIL